jgi:hypothetical protein
MLPFKLLFLSAICLTVLSGAAATWIALTDQGSQPSPKKVAERLAQIAVLGAAAIFTLLGRAAD